VQPAPPRLPTHPKASSLSQPSSSHDYLDLHATFRPIQEKQTSLQAYVETERASLRNFIQEWYDELCGMFASPNQYSRDFGACLETWGD